MVFSKRGCAKDTDGPITYRPVQKTQTGSLYPIDKMLIRQGKPILRDETWDILIPTRSR
jgi:hypothetical protein